MLGYNIWKPQGKGPTELCFFGFFLSLKPLGLKCYFQPKPTSKEKCDPQSPFFTKKKKNDPQSHLRTQMKVTSALVPSFKARTDSWLENVRLTDRRHGSTLCPFKQGPSHQQKGQRRAEIPELWYNASITQV